MQGGLCVKFACKTLEAAIVTVGSALVFGFVGVAENCLLAVFEVISEVFGLFAETEELSVAAEVDTCRRIVVVAVFVETVVEVTRLVVETETY